MLGGNAEQKYFQMSFLRNNKNIKESKQKMDRD